MPAVKATGTPVVVVIMAGRPLTITNLLPEADSVLFAWHPGTMAGPALCDLIFGDASPSGRLPATFPKMVGQIPIYYNQKNTGRPPSKDSVLHIDDIEPGATQTSFGMTAFHLDAGFEPLFPFGFGLGYADCRYHDLQLSHEELGNDDTLQISIAITNSGERDATETAQLYVRDLVGSIMRPVRELKGFQRVVLRPGETKRVTFKLDVSQLAFFGRRKLWAVEPGNFQLWVGPNAAEGQTARFAVR